ncbi:kinase-like protein [Gigaspora margarita]|uniref:non-specific serine/threonine protein kinase n=1 Tax=Gigaspora margarita TaxID=4874 RepID=A0A8H4A398_GIGMA|nr:kinase-like protein [Gigaspora margarita]
MSGNPEINVVKSPNDTVQSSAQNNISSNHLSTSFIPANLQPSCDIDRSTLSISESDYVAEGGYGRVYKAKWNGKLVAAKFISRRGPEQLKDFARELRALRKSKDCLEHIIEFFGLSKEPVTGDYILVMQYADSGTLKNYLENHTEPNTRELLDQRIDLCKDILKGLVFLHGERIIHRDLHSNNVLIHLGKALLADFGLSKSVLSQESTIVRGMHPYVDPEVLNYFKYPPKESSDIYSFGVLMWEIYTCIPSFSGRRDRDLVNDICNGVREKRKVGMPTDYVNLYEKCWNKKPLSRPTAKDALEDLETLKLKPTITEDDLQSIYGMIS